MVIYLLVTKKINKNNSNLTNSLVDILLIQNIKNIKIYKPKLDIYSDYVIISTATSSTQMNSALTKTIKHFKSLGLRSIIRRYQFIMDTIAVKWCISTYLYRRGKRLLFN